MKPYKNTSFAFLLLMLLAAPMVGHGQVALRAKHFNLDNGLAIEGYDPVAYFTTGKATEGKKQISFTVEGVTYRFANEGNKSAFAKDPKKYEPQYGGWCAYAMGATKEKVNIDPETFKIVNGKLHLYYNSWGNNTLVKWNAKEATWSPAADRNWTLIYK